MAPPDVTSSQGQRRVTASAGAAISERQALRLELRRRRSQLSTAERGLAAAAITRQLLDWPAFRSARRIASYHSVVYEVCTRELNTWLQASSKSLYLPCLPVNRLGRLLFRQVGEQTRWCISAYGIPEPQPSRSTAPATSPAFLNMILVPLVGFDELGNRMGMGAGFYDRSLAFRRLRRIWHRPRLVGLAYACQQVERLPAQPWDVPLDAIVTENGIITPRSST